MINTPPEVLEKWRKEFERAAKEKYPKTEFGIYADGSYWTAWIDNLWVGFKMARQTAVIELPDFQKGYSMDSYWPGYNDGLRTAANVIESQGYRVEVKGD